jgi:flagellar biosynthetic protein FliR
VHFVLPDFSGSIVLYMLVFARTGAMIMLLPAIGDVGVPARVRLGLALAVSLALMPVVQHSYPATAVGAGTGMQLAILIAQEVTAGVVVGAMARIIMSAMSVAGNLIATQTGLAYAQTLDPSMGEAGAVVGNFLTLLATVLIFATNLHHLAIGAIQGSYALIPPGQPLPTADLAELAIRLVSGSFALGFQLAAPFLVFGFALYAALGILARLMPQLQVFFVAMPINILAGLLLLVLVLGTMMTVFLNYYTEQMGTFIGA